MSTRHTKWKKRNFEETPLPIQHRGTVMKPPPHPQTVLLANSRFSAVFDFQCTATLVMGTMELFPEGSIYCCIGCDLFERNEVRNNENWFSFMSIELKTIRKVVNRNILTRRCPTGCIHHQWDYLSQFFLKLNWTWIPSVTVACTWYRSISLDVMQE
ncbi:hypothetical protein T02_1775 [Trichinella nativa]|uniref:Uncharacterized protein n=1 Tax=Trichinella nativa TaxID=6335 RepID=A0A0V1L041_9BILA|nr:hypothetical protein T02_1775 [Trichinella nativa]